MADQTKFLHTWEMNRNSLLIRFYQFWYGIFDVDVNNLSFCKLFWCTILSPLMIVVYLSIGIFFVVVWPIATISDRMKRRSTNSSKVKEPRTKNRRAKDAAVKLASSTEGFFGHISAFLQRHAWISKTLKWGLLVVGAICALAGAAGIGYLSYMGVEEMIKNWNLGVSDGVYIVLSFIGAVILITGVIYTVSETKYGAPIRALGRGFAKVGNFLATGYYAVKYRTCPRIVVK